MTFLQILFTPIMTYLTNTSLMFRRSMEDPFIPLDIMIELQRDPTFNSTDEKKFIQHYAKYIYPLQQPQFTPWESPKTL